MSKPVGHASLQDALHSAMLRHRQLAGNPQIASRNAVDKIAADAWQTLNKDMQQVAERTDS